MNQYRVKIICGFGLQERLESQGNMMLQMQLCLASFSLHKGKKTGRNRGRKLGSHIREIDITLKAKVHSGSLM